MSINYSQVNIRTLYEQTQTKFSYLHFRMTQKTNTLQKLQKKRFLGDKLFSCHSNMKPVVCLQKFLPHRPLVKIRTAVDTLTVCCSTPFVETGGCWPGCWSGLNCGSVTTVGGAVACVGMAPACWVNSSIPVWLN